MKHVNIRQLAEAIDPSSQVNCGTCSLRDLCRDPSKHRRYACARWMEEAPRDDPSGADFLDLMRDLVQKETLVPDPYSIDDREAPLAPNSYAWNCSPRFLKFRPMPYPKQLQLSLKIYGDLCSFCRGPWYDDIPVDADVRDIPRKVSLRKFGICHRCGKSRLDGISEGREKDIDTLISILGQRSGKSSGMSLIISYQLHQLLKIKNPSAFYGIKGGTVLYHSILGINYTGAKQNVYDPLIAAIDDSPWFETYRNILDDVAKRRGDDELYRIKDTFMFFKTAGLNIAPAAPSRRSLRGKTRIGFCQDEMGHFGESEKLVNISGAEVWRALTRSLWTVRPAIARLRRGGRVHIPPALAVAISSPWSITDPIMTLYNRTVKSPDHTAYTAIWPTWEANPDITQKSLASEFALDPVSAWRDFGCRPPYSANAFITGINTFRAAVRQDVLPAAIQRTRHVRIGDKTVVTADLKFRYVDKTTPRLLAMDAGRHLNSFGVAVMHIDEDDRLVYDLFVEVVPRPEVPVSYTLMWENVLLPIVQNLGVVASVSDRWQNYSINDALQGMGVTVTERRLKYGDFVAWRDDLTNGAFDVPRPEIAPKLLKAADGPEMTWLTDKPVAQLIRQSIIVVDVPGKTVEKPSEGNDDVFRCAVLGHAALLSPEMREIVKPSNPFKRVVGAIAAFSSASGGAGSLDAVLPTGEKPRTSRSMGVVVGSGFMNRS